MADPVVHLTNGIPDSGTGNVTTLGQTLLDGANVTIGAKADAKSVSTDTTPITAMSVWKQISASVQALVTAFGAAWTRGAGAADANTQRVTVDSSQLATLGTAADAASQPVAWSTEGKAQVGALTETAPATDTASSGLNGRLQRIAQRITTMFTTGLSNRAFAVAFATLTRPANITAYSAADSISDNATAGSVTALVSGSIGDVNDDPLFISDIVIKSTDTGLAGKRIRAYVYNSDPTASSGVGGGDNAAFSNKIAGYVGSFSGTLETGFSDGTVGRLVPSFNDSATAPVPNVGAGGFITVKPVTGAKTLYVQYQTLDAFTPSANSTTIIGTIRGWQGRAA